MSKILFKKAVFSTLRTVQKIITALIILAAGVYLILWYLTNIKESIPEVWVLFGEMLGGALEWCEPSAKMGKTIQLCSQYKQLADELYEDYNNLIGFNGDPTRQTTAHYILIERTKYYEENYDLESEGKPVRAKPTCLETVDAAERAQEAEVLRTHASQVALGEVVSRRLSVSAKTTTESGASGATDAAGSTKAVPSPLPAVLEEESSSSGYSYTDTEEFVDGVVTPAQSHPSRVGYPTIPLDEYSDDSGNSTLSVVSVGQRPREDSGDGTYFPAL